MNAPAAATSRLRHLIASIIIVVAGSSAALAPLSDGSQALMPEVFSNTVRELNQLKRALELVGGDA